MRTPFPLSSHRLLHVVHGRHRLLDHPTLRRANLSWRALPWCRRSSVRPPHDIEKSVVVYTPPCHCQATLLSKLLQSSLNLHFLLSAPFFSTGALCLRHLISREYGKQRARKLSEERWRLSNENPSPKARHGSNVDAAGGVINKQSLVMAAMREI